MTKKKTIIYTYLHAKTNKQVSQSTFNVNNLESVLRDNLYTLTVSKIIKHGSYLWEGVEFDNVVYFLESETV